MLTFCLVILYLVFLYYATIGVFKTLKIAKNVFNPDLERLADLWNSVRIFERRPWNSDSKMGRLKMRLFYYFFYLPYVILLFLIDTAVICAVVLCVGAIVYWIFKSLL